MPSKIPEHLIKKIEKIYVGSSETYANLSQRFAIGLSTLERIGSERGWPQKRDEARAKKTQRKLARQVDNAAEAMQRLGGDINNLDEFNRARLLKIVRKGLVTFETAFDEYGV